MYAEIVRFDSALGLPKRLRMFNTCGEFKRWFDVELPAKPNTYVVTFPGGCDVPLTVLLPILRPLRSVEDTMAAAEAVQAALWE